VIGLAIIGACVALLFGLVGSRRRVANRWHETRPVVARASGRDHAISFDKVWAQPTLPRAALRAHRDRVTGTLRFMPEKRQAVFRSNGGERWDIKHLREVTFGARGSDFINTWIEAVFGIEDSPSTLYMNDGGWFGWRALLTSRNTRIASALRDLLDSDSAAPYLPIGVSRTER
jgi:hypothetical protein